MTATDDAPAMTARDHGLRVAVLDALQDTVDKAYKAARKDAEPVFAAVRREGQTQQKVLLPDGEEIGLISIRGGSPSVTMADADLEAWVREHLPDDIEDYVEPSAWANLDVIEVVRAVFPHLVKSRIRQVTRDALLKEIKDSGGWLIDKETSEKTRVAEVTTHKPTGSFSYRAAAGTPQRIVAEWLAGNLAGVDLGGALALPPAGADSPAAATAAERADEEAELRDAVQRGLGLFADEHGFYSPETAAAHAIVVQGGFSTPPIEAYRMIRDGGEMAERAKRWLADHGLDPEDPREGKDIPWPLTDPEAGDDNA